MPTISPRAHILSPFDMRPIISCPPTPCGRSSHTVHIIVASPVKKTSSKRKPTPQRTHVNRRRPSPVRPIARKPTPKRTHGNRKNSFVNRRRPSPIRPISRKPKKNLKQRRRKSPIRPMSRKPSVNRRRRSKIRNTGLIQQEYIALLTDKKKS